jgi:hypothetical protein
MIARINKKKSVLINLPRYLCHYFRGLDNRVEQLNCSSCRRFIKGFK